MAVDERLDLKLSAADKRLFAQAAAIEWVSMAAFVRLAAKQRAAEAIERERLLSLSQQDFTASKPLSPNRFLATPRCGRRWSRPALA